MEEAPRRLMVRNGDLDIAAWALSGSLNVSLGRVEKASGAWLPSFSEKSGGCDLLGVQLWEGLR